uniref:Uncharacterized protein DDB_G0283697 n=1 Tax=Phallusia mammillata TaxID=59560 RepID=A0A6F9DDZ6_9ASCI|nr:uncharacterized protein DDB_G0283697 [Phallusia mammillata]
MSSRSPSPRQNSSYPDRRNARKSISLSPIRTESGANLRTANWTKMRFRAPGESRGAFQQSNWNQRNYNNYNNYRGNFNPRGRWQNRGRGNYRGNWNQRGGGYVPKRRTYSRNYDSRSRSRSYSRSRSRDRSYSSERRRSYSRSRSRSLSKSRSRSRDPPQRAPAYKLSPKVEDKPISKPVAAPFFRETEKFSKKTLEPGKVGLSKWDSPDKKFDDDAPAQKSAYPFSGQQTVEKSAFKTNMEFKSFPTYEQATAGGQIEQEGHSAAQVQQMMEKTALASVARHEKSLMKIRKAQGKMKKVSKSDSSDDNLDENEILQMMKSVKKAKKKKNKNKMSKKMAKAKLKKMKLATVSSSSDSDDKSSDNSSDSSNQEGVKKRAMSASRKKKHTKVKPGSMSPQPKKIRQSDDTNLLNAYNTPAEMRKDIPVQSSTPFMPQTIAQAPGNQPVMLMAPGLGDMRFLGANGQPMNLIQLAVPGPDGQMQLIQIPSMGGDGQQPIVMLPPTAMQQPQQPVTSFPTTSASSVSQPQPVAPPKPVPPPAPPGEPPTHNKTAFENKLNQFDDGKQTGQFANEKELTEKQKRRKEVIRTRLWPRPATSTWDEEGGEAQEETENTETPVDNGKRQSDSWPKPATSSADGNMTSFPYNSESIASHAKQDTSNRENIPGFSPDAKNKTEGQKIPTLSRGSMLSQHVDNVKETIDELPRKKPEIVEHVSIGENRPTSNEGVAYHQPQLVAYPSHITQHAYEPVYTGNQPPIASSAAPTRTTQGEFAKGKDSKWTAAAEEFIRDRQPQKKSKYDAPAESSSEEDFTTALLTKKSKKQAYEAQMMEMQDDDMAYHEEEAKKMKKKKKSKKERKDSMGTEEATSPVMKEKKRKKKKKNKEKDYENNSDAESKKSRKQEKKNQEKSAEAEDDDLVRRIPSDLPLSHIRGLVVRQEKEGIVSIFHNIDFSKLAPESEFAEEKDSYEDQFVSLFGSTSGESKPAKTSPLNMSKKALRKIKVAPKAPRSVAHMTEVSLSERIGAIMEANKAEEKQKNVSQKVSVNLASLSWVDDKYEKPKSPVKSRSSTPDKRRHRSRTSSYGSESSRSRSRSRSSRSGKSLPKAYSGGDRSFERHRDHHDRSRSRSRSRDGDRRPYRNNNRGYFQPYNNRYNQRYQQRGRGNFVNYRARGRFFHRGFNNNRGYNNYNNYNNNYRGRGYYNNNNRDQNQWRNRRHSYRSDDEERRDRRRSRSYSISDRRTGSSGSSDEDDRRDAPQDKQEKNSSQAQETEQPYPSEEGTQGNQQMEENVKVRRKSPEQWTHDMFEEHEKE